MLRMRYKLIKITMRIMVKIPDNFKNRGNCEKCTFSRNPIYPLPREGLFPYQW